MSPFRPSPLGWPAILPCLRLKAPYGAAVVVGCALLGAAWLVWRTRGGLHDRCCKQARVLGVAALAMIGAVSLWTPVLNGTLMARWFGWPGILPTSPVPVLVARRLWRGLQRGERFAPFGCALDVFLLRFVGLGASICPLMALPSLTIWDIAPPRSNQLFPLVGASVLIPTIPAHTA